MSREIEKTNSAKLFSKAAQLYIVLALAQLSLSFSLSSSPSISLTVLRFVAGILLWSLMEYLLHRFPLHAKLDGTLLKKLMAHLHNEHHKRPDEAAVLVTTFAVSFPIYTLTCGLIWVISHSISLVLELGAGVIAGYLVYEWVHFYTHLLPAKSKLGKFLKKYHMSHHHKDSSRGFGVTTPVWDFVFRTWPEKI